MIDREFIELQNALAGEYSLERELGRGGMGVVYLAREVQLDRLVAIKMLPGGLAARPEIRERFLREARMAASLSHPHIVPIYRVGEANGLVFFVMAYVQGETLGERLRGHGPLSAAAATRLLHEVTWALSYAHGRGIVHRDIKPDNILLEAETGRALVTDFGIARGAAETSISDPGQIMGTAHFMSPEQATNEPVDGRSDLYSLGVVGYLATSGKLPFDASNIPALIAKHALAEPAALSSVAPSLPRGLADVINKCLRKLPSERFASGEALAEALEATATPARAKLPMALRVWTQAVDPLRPLYFAWSGIFTMGLMSELKAGGDWPILLGFALVPMVPLTIFHARKTYQVLAAGYALRDLQAALTSWRTEKREQLAFELGEAESTWAKALRILSYAFASGVAYLFVNGEPHTLFVKILIASTVVGAVATLTVSSALGVRMISTRIRPKLIGAVRSLIFNSRVGEWATKLLTPKSRKRVADLGYRPTEMALGLAVGDLFAALPLAYREHLSDLPAVVERLEAHAAAARARVDEIAALLSMGGDGAPQTRVDNLLRSRDAAKRELAESISALEAVRFDLLRLHGGASDLGQITTVLQAARDLGEELDRLAKGQREADDAVRPLGFDLRPHTPA
ncbi:MAG: serine/threonine-protein kinase [Gemmatimonadaceae bacterium]